MGKNSKFTEAQLDEAFWKGYSAKQAEYEFAAAEFGEDQIEEAPEPVEQKHNSYTLTVRYKHTKYADEDTDFTTALVKELAEDEFRFVTDHFDVLSVEVTDDSTWVN
jgi:hypothetical protein